MHVIAHGPLGTSSITILSYSKVDHRTGMETRKSSFELLSSCRVASEVLAFAQPGIPAEFEYHPLPTDMCRRLLLVKVPGLVIGTVHLESLANPNMRREQLKCCAAILAPFADAMLVGDFNFDSEQNFKPPHDPLENSALALLQNFSDLWTVLRPGEAGKTFDSTLNPYIGEYERMRYDRVMAKLQAWRPKEIRLVGDEPLDHIPLTPKEQDSRHSFGLLVLCYTPEGKRVSN